MGMVSLIGKLFGIDAASPPHAMKLDGKTETTLVRSLSALPPAERDGSLLPRRASLLDWSQDDLARAAELSVPTINRLEAIDGPLGGRGHTAEKIVRAIMSAGIEFIAENGGDQAFEFGKRLDKNGNKELSAH